MGCEYERKIKTYPQIVYWLTVDWVLSGQIRARLERVRGNVPCRVAGMRIPPVTVEAGLSVAKSCHTHIRRNLQLDALQSMEEAIPNVLVVGTGSPGHHIGNALRECGVHVDFLPDLDSLHRGPSSHLAGTYLARSTDLVLFAVDANRTLASAMRLQLLLPRATPVVALQPGIRRLLWAAQAAPHLQWIRCVMAFDPAQLSQPQSEAVGSRKLYLSDTPQTRHWRPCIERAGYEVELCADIQSVQWGYLLLQLNAVLMLVCGLDFQQMLAARAWRLRYARLLDEVLGLLAASGIEPRNLLGVPWRTVPMMLRLNDAMFSWMAARHFSGVAEGLPDLSCADESSLELAIDATCGEIMRLAVGQGADAPRTVELTEQLRDVGRPSNEARIQLNA